MSVTKRGKRRWSWGEGEVNQIKVRERRTQESMSNEGGACRLLRWWFILLLGLRNSSSTTDRLSNQDAKFQSSETRQWDDKNREEKPELYIFSGEKHWSVPQLSSVDLDNVVKGSKVMFQFRLEKRCAEVISLMTNRRFDLLYKLAWITRQESKERNGLETWMERREIVYLFFSFFFNSDQLHLCKESLTHWILETPIQQTFPLFKVNIDVRW